MPIEAKKIWKRKEVRERYRISEPTLERMVSTGQFPAPVLITPGRKGWFGSTLDEYDSSLVEKSRIITKSMREANGSERPHIRRSAGEDQR